MSECNVVRLPAAVHEPHLREVNHRIANQLAQLSGYLELKAREVRVGPAAIPRDVAAELLRTISGRILGIGEVHRMLAEHAREQRVELGEFLLQFSSTMIGLLSLRDAVAVSYRLDGKCLVPQTVAHTMGLILSELVMNAVKHAHPSGLRVGMDVICTCGLDQVLVEFSDDGVGLPENFDICADGGSGFQIIRALADSIDASLKIESDSLGLTFRLDIPVTPP